jgi:lipopolysaccharide export system protein LptA
MRRRRAKPLSWQTALAACTVVCVLSGAALAADAEKKEEPSAAQKSDTKQKSETKKSAAKQKSDGKSDSKKNTQDSGFSKNEPIYITSDRMEADRQKNVLVYIGQVVAIQGDMTLRSDKLTTYFDPDLQQIKQAIAEGKQVRMTKGDRLAIGTKAVFDGVAQSIIMTGCPIVRQGNSEIAGEKITYFMVEDRVIVESGKCGRVNGTIFPEEFQQDQKKEGEPKKAADTKAEPKKAADNKGK